MEETSVYPFRCRELVNDEECRVVYAEGPASAAHSYFEEMRSGCSSVEDVDVEIEVVGNDGSRFVYGMEKIPGPYHFVPFQKG